MFRKVSTLLDCHTISLAKSVAVDDNASIELILADIDFEDRS